MAAGADVATIRALLNNDRPWCAYMIGDLAPGLFEKVELLHTDGAAPALAALYRGFTPPVLFTFGDANALAPLVERLCADPAIYLHVRPEVVQVLPARYRIAELRPMWRMVWATGADGVASTSGAERLKLADRDAVERLYADGDAAGERPDFYLGEMIEQGVFYGIREGGELTAVAGTHLVVPGEGVGAIGNVYTRRDRRGRGLAACVTRAVVYELLRLNLRTIVLNVGRDNATAVRLYERLGFTRYCEYCEGRIET